LQDKKPHEKPIYGTSSTPKQFKGSTVMRLSMRVSEADLVLHQKQIKSAKLMLHKKTKLAKE
jgi:hypothetical protein